MVSLVLIFVVVSNFFSFFFYCFVCRYLFVGSSLSLSKIFYLYSFCFIIINFFS